MHCGGANALKSCHIITTDTRLNSSSLIQHQAIFQGVPRWLSILCKTEKWFCPALLKLISSGCRLEVESFKIKYWFFGLMSLTKWEEKCMFHTDSFFKTDDKTSFYGAIYSTLTSPTLSRVTKVAFKCPLAQLSEEGLLIQIAFFVWSLSLNAKSQPQTKHIIQGSIRICPDKRPRPAGDALMPSSNVCSVYIPGPVITVSLISITMTKCHNSWARCNHNQMKPTYLVVFPFWCWFFFEVDLGDNNNVFFSQLLLSSSLKTLKHFLFSTFPQMVQVWWIISISSDFIVG